jgi:hypothetical protein
MAARIMLRGTVVDGNGNPVSGAYVGVTAAAHDGETDCGSSGSAVTDSEGRFVVEGLDPRPAYGVFASLWKHVDGHGEKMWVEALSGKLRGDRLATQSELRIVLRPPG